MKPHLNTCCKSRHLGQKGALQIFVALFLGQKPPLFNNIPYCGWPGSQAPKAAVALFVFLDLGLGSEWPISYNAGMMCCDAKV